MLIPSVQGIGWWLGCLELLGIFHGKLGFGVLSLSSLLFSLAAL